MRIEWNLFSFAIGMACAITAIELESSLVYYGSAMLFYAIVLSLDGEENK